MEVLVNIIVDLVVVFIGVAAVVVVGGSSNGSSGSRSHSHMRDICIYTLVVAELVGGVLGSSGSSNSNSANSLSDISVLNFASLRCFITTYQA